MQYRMRNGVPPSSRIVGAMICLCRSTEQGADGDAAADEEDYLEGGKGRRRLTVDLESINDASIARCVWMGQLADRQAQRVAPPWA
jgi:hypothetical protein